MPSENSSPLVEIQQTITGYMARIPDSDYHLKQMNLYYKMAMIANQAVRKETREKSWYGTSSKKGHEVEVQWCAQMVKSINKGQLEAQLSRMGTLDTIIKAINNYYKKPGTERAKTLNLWAAGFWAEQAKDRSGLELTELCLGWARYMS
jgi:hypothetical protein